jgi:adenosylcobalamin-dependent ribonucleoside-triphosphate reductase
LQFIEVQTPAKKYAKGMGKAVADRTINRRTFREFKKKTWIKVVLPVQSNTAEQINIAASNWASNNDYRIKDVVVIKEIGDNLIEAKIAVLGKYETEEWEDVSYRVALGNALLCPVNEQQVQTMDDTFYNESAIHRRKEFEHLNHHLRQASLLMSGRHLQHGDDTQPYRNQEVFTNCSTSATSFMTFLLLMNGSGVGRCYDDDMMAVNWDNMPTVVTVIDQGHKDVLSGEITSMDRRNAEHMYAHKQIHIFEVPDTREGWAKAIEQIEVMAYDSRLGHDVLILDFSKVRPRGSPILGMQGRPASGPGPLINAINNVAKVKHAGMEPWRQALYIDHYLAECVLVGGARRSARMSTKTWRDPSILEFIAVKRGGFLWSSNNSVTVDEEFWFYVTANEENIDDRIWNGNGLSIDCRLTPSELSIHAKTVFQAITEAAYKDGTGEPGIINQHMLTHNNAGLEVYKATGEFIGSKKFQPELATKELLKNLADRMLHKPLNMITNPCGEITLNILGGYCVIADVVPYHAKDDNDAEDAFRTATRALIRTNTMDCLYRPEVDRTNRIGVGITGLHEYAWKRFGYGWKDLVSEEKSKDFWSMLSRFKDAVAEEATEYATLLGVTVPHTNTTIKPAGTTSKLFGLTEGAHLPSMREYLRWVQFKSDDPLVKQYEALGYPVKRLQVYQGSTVVGFPTRPEICKLGMGDKLVTAAEATPEEQYEYLRLLEKYWIKGVNQTVETGNQVSYTLKYDPKAVSFEDFQKVILEQQSTVRCCSVMPQTDLEGYAYEYLPEHPVTKHEYEQIMNAIKDDDIKEDVGVEHVACDNGVCPISFNENSAAMV